MTQRYSLIATRVRSGEYLVELKYKQGTRQSSVDNSHEARDLIIEAGKILRNDIGIRKLEIIVK